MIKYFRIFFKLVEVTIDISVFCHISSIFFFIFFFFSFDMPSGSIAILVVLSLGSEILILGYGVMVAPDTLTVAVWVRVPIA